MDVCADQSELGDQRNCHKKNLRHTLPRVRRQASRSPLQPVSALATIALIATFVTSGLAVARRSPSSRGDARWQARRSSAGRVSKKEGKRPFSDGFVSLGGACGPAGGLISSPLSLKLKDSGSWLNGWRATCRLPVIGAIASRTSSRPLCYSFASTSLASARPLLHNDSLRTASRRAKLVAWLT